MLFPDFAKRKPVFYAFSCRNNANFTILVHVELHERAFLSPFPSSGKNSNRFSIRQNIFSHSMTAPNIFPAIFHLFSSFFSTHFRAFFPIFSPDSLHFPSNSSPLLLPSLSISSPFPPIFVRFISVCCTSVVRCFIEQQSDNNRTTIGQQLEV